MVLPGKGIGWKDFVRSVAKEYKEDQLGDVSAALTFFAVLAVFPFLLFVVALASVIIEPHQARQLVEQLGKVAPPDVTRILGDRMSSLANRSSGGLLTLGGLGAIWAASGGIVALMRSLNRGYDVEESRPFWKVRLIAIGTTVAVGALALLALLVAVALPPIARAIGGPAETIVTWARFPVAALLMMLVWALLYYVLPDVEQKFKFLSPGSVIGVIIWVLASWGFSVYVSNFGKYEATYGTLGGVIVLLLWMWISSQVILLGAEINSVLEHASPEGKREGAKSLKDRGATPTREERERGASRWPPHRERAEQRWPAAERAEELQAWGETEQEHPVGLSRRREVRSWRERAKAPAILAAAVGVGLYVGRRVAGRA